MIGSFSLDGVSSESFDIVAKSIKRPLLPEKKVTRVEVAGLSGAYDTEDEEYSIRKIKMRIAYIGSTYEELRSKARSIAAWLTGSAWKQLIINDETDKYYLAKVTSEIDLDSLYESGKADVSFDCQPFALSVSEETDVRTVTVGDSFSLTNPGTRKINYQSPEGSKLLITIDGSFSTLTIDVNGTALTVNSSQSGVMTLDSIEMEFKIGGVNKFDLLSGDTDKFFTMEPGNNVITISGTSLNFDLTIAYIPLWI